MRCDAIGIHHRPRHGKTLGLALIRRILNSESFGSPQFIAGALLLAYLLQCVWLIRNQADHGVLPTSDQALCIYDGLEQWKGKAIAGTPQALGAEAASGIPSVGRNGHLRVRDGYDQDRSPFYYLVAAAPILALPRLLPPDSPLGQIWASLPYLFFGVMLGASLWYVSRRLYGNAGGYIALVLYCFSPGIIMNTAGAQNLGEMAGTWGAFGTIFTAIAVAHTLYAPREVILWNGKRIMLLGLSLALAVGTQFSLAILAIVALPIMFWVAPVRRRAVIAIWTVALAVAAVLLLAFYFFQPEMLWQVVLRARWIDLRPQAFAMPNSYWQTLKAITANSPPLMLGLPIALIAYCAWKRARYFGNTAPLLIAGLLFVLAVGSPDFSAQGFHLAMLTFLYVFVAGVFADLLETRQSAAVAAGLWGLLGAASVWNLLQLARLR
jgi:hypothetical protein